MSIKDGGPAFPIAFNEGMTLRQWYAGLAMQGLLANSDRVFNQWEIADISADIADTMLDKLAGDNK